VAGKVPPTMEELRAQTEYQPANDPLGFPQITAQEIVNRFLDRKVKFSAGNDDWDRL